MKHQKTQDSLEFFVSKPKLLLLNLFLLLIIGMTITFIPKVGLFFKGLLTFAFIIVGFLWILHFLALFESEPQIRIDDVGILIRNNPSSPVLWDDIVNVQIASRKGLNFLLVNVKNPENYSISGTQTKKPHFMLSFFLLKPSPQEALIFIRSRYQDKLQENIL